MAQNLGGGTAASSLSSPELILFGWPSGTLQLYSSDPCEKEVSGWLEPRAPKLMTAELVELGLLITPTYTHTHLPSGECGPHPSHICGKVQTGHQCGLWPQTPIPEQRAPCCTTQRQLVRGGRRAEKEGRERGKTKKGVRQGSS